MNQLLSKRSNLARLCLLFAFLAVLGACARTGPAEIPTQTPLQPSPPPILESSPTQAAVATAQPTLTAEPALLNTPVPTPTLIPSLTPIIRDTQVLTTSQVITGTTGAAFQALPSVIYAYSQGTGYFSWTPEKGRISLGRYDPAGPDAVLAFSFAHFVGRLAYWKEDRVGELWLADLAFTNLRQLFSDQEREYRPDDEASTVEFIDLLWSPDDQHLIVEVAQNKSLNLIYHEATLSLETWPFTCDRIALSPSTRKLATWCHSAESEDTFAVIEWGGQIWYSQSPSANEFLRMGRDGLQTWAWSADGERIAYFDPADTEGKLSIADNRGKVLLEALPGGAYWTGDPTVRLTRPPSPPLQWSQDGSRLLVYAHDSPDHPCLGSTGTSSPNQVIPPCWKVVEASSGEVLWTIAGILDQLLSPSQQVGLQGNAFTDPVLSPDGRFLALNVRIAGLRGVYLVDLSTSQAQRVIDFNVQALRWGPAP